MNNPRIIATVEGLTEQTFVREMLAPWLADRGVFLSARLVGEPGHKGGVGAYVRAKKDILALLKQESSTIVTTMFDFYGMPISWPGRESAGTAIHHRKAPIVEDALRNDIAKALGRKFDQRRFVPYIQMHEYEALIFTRPLVIAEVVEDPAIGPKLVAVREKFKTPEEINDTPTTAPSKRIERLHPTYEKPLHGVIAAQRIGIETIREECPHFHEWLTALEELGGSQ